MTCNTCPFAFTDVSEHVQNLGCLPTSNEIVTMRVKHNRMWACHCNVKIPCQGAIKHLKSKNITS